VQCSVEKVAASIAGEDSARPVSAVSGGCQSDHQQSRPRVAESRHRTPPVLPVAEAPHLLAGDPLPMSHKPWASPATDDLLAERVKPSHGAVSPFDPSTALGAQEKQRRYLLAAAISASYWAFSALVSCSIPSIPFLIVVQTARDDARIARYSASMISAVLAPACFAAAKRAPTQEVQPAAAIAAIATNWRVFSSKASS